MYQRRRTLSLSKRAKAFYESSLREELETSRFGDFVAIEPESEQYFVASTFIDAALAAKNAIPGKMSFVIRVGHDAAVHIGAASV